MHYTRDNLVARFLFALVGIVAIESTSARGHVDDGIIRFDVTAMSGQYSQINSVTLRMFKYLNGESGVFNNVSDRWVDLFTIPAVDNWVEGTAAGVGGAAQFGTATQSQPQL